MVPKVSVLTPVYNMEKYLAQCLDSLAAQTLDNIEFICINDGSTDNSLAILQEYAARDARFQIIDKPNSGYGASMNMGIAHAKGEYIGIVESDDFADAGMFEALYAAAHEYNCDVVRSNRFDFTNNSEILVEMFAGFEYGVVFSPAEKQEIFEPPPAIWSCLFRRDFLLENDIDFLETPGASYQDAGFIYKSLLAAERVMLVKDAFLHYRIDNTESSVKSKSKVYCVCDEFASIDKFLAQNPHREQTFRAAIQALRYQTYQWNYNRLSWKLKRDFLLQEASEFRQMQNAEALSADRFSELDWARLQKMIADPEALFASEAPQITVIVPAYNAERHLRETLESLEQQSIQRMEVIVIDDGSTDATPVIADEFAALHPRFFVIHQENQGLSGARNTGLDNASGEYVSFIDAEDLVLEPFALEELRRLCIAKDAELSVGIIREFNAILDHEFERTVMLTEKEETDKYDTNLIWSFSVNNKLFLRKKIEDLGLRFETGRYNEDGLFLMSYVYTCKRIACCPSVVLDYRRDLFWDGFSITHSASKKHVEDLVYIHEQVIEQAKKSFERDIMAADGNELLKRKFAYQQIAYVNELHQRLVSYLIDLQYRRLWLLEDDAVDLLLAKIEEHRAYIAEDVWKDMCAYHADLALDTGLKTKDAAVHAPHISCVLCLGPSHTSEQVRLFFDALYHNTLPFFEVLAPADCKHLIPEKYRVMPNLRLVYIDDENVALENVALQLARAPFIMFMREAIYPNTQTLKELFNWSRNSLEDMAVGPIAAIQNDNQVLWLSQKTVFSQRRADGFSRASSFNQYDCSLNNKLLKTQTLLSSGVLFSGESATDAAMLYDVLSFRKYPDFLFITRLEEKEFLGRRSYAEMARTAAAYAIDRFDVDHIKRFLEPYVDKTIKYANAVERHALPKDYIAFYTNQGALSENLLPIYERLEGNKVVLAQPIPYSQEYEDYVRRVLQRSKLVILDGDCHPLFNFELDWKRTKIVQLWHASGAFKKFGLDNVYVPSWQERPKHEHYSLVCVSSEIVRPMYASAFGLDLDVVQALGVPKTDVFFDAIYCEQKRKEFFASFPEYRDKRIVLYCPTFRQRDGLHVAWNPQIDWETLSDSLPDDVVFMVKQHPIEGHDIMDGYRAHNVVCPSTVSSGDALYAADLLITDYSSIVFDAALLNKRVLFYCHDLQDYQTGFYINFPDDLNGELVEDPQIFVDAVLRNLAADVPDNRNEHIIQRFLGSCDGKSADRIVAYIKEHFL